MVEKIGAFEISSDTLFAGDPLYLYDPQCHAQIDHCALGTWDAWAALPDHEKQIVFRTPLVRTLAVFHESCPLEREPVLEMEAPESGSDLPEGFEVVRRDVPQDIRACGFFDCVLAGKDLESDLGGLAGLLDAEFPVEPPCGLVLPGGAVASIMRRDGAWSCFVHRNETGQADAAVLRFRWEEIETIVADVRNSG